MMNYVMSFCILAALMGCVIAPRHAHPPAGVVVPAGVVYVAPTYPIPAPGYIWSHHHKHGWGWHHKNHGWHRGW
jgi:hypothetical protein